MQMTQNNPAHAQVRLSFNDQQACLHFNLSTGEVIDHDVSVSQLACLKTRVIARPESTRLWLQCSPSDELEIELPSVAMANQLKQDLKCFGDQLGAPRRKGGFGVFLLGLGLGAMLTIGIALWFTAEAIGPVATQPEPISDASRSAAEQWQP